MRHSLCLGSIVVLAACSHGAGGPTSSGGGGGGAVVCSAGMLDCDGNPANGCEVDPTTDAKNCGKCGHDCRGGPCAASACGAGMLVPGAAGPMALDATDVYFGADQVLPSLPGVVVARVPKAGGAAVSVLADPKTMAVRAIGLDADSVYLVDDGNKVLVAPKSGGSKATTLASGASLSGQTLPVDASGVYYTAQWTSYTTGQLMRVSKTGGTPTALATDKGIAALASDGAGVYWLTCDFHVKKQPLGGGATTVLASLTPTGNCPVYDLPVDMGKLFFGGYVDAIVHEVGTTGGSSTVVSNTEALYLGAGGGYVYFAGADPMQIGVAVGLWTVPESGGTPTKLADDKIAQVVADADAVYWIDKGPSGGLKVLVR